VKLPLANLVPKDLEVLAVYRVLVVPVVHLVLVV
jgi:hypothetical protein